MRSNPPALELGQEGLGLLRRQHHVGVAGTLTVVPGSGTGAFADVGGSGVIKAVAGEHGGEYCLSLQKVARA